LGILGDIESSLDNSERFGIKINLYDQNRVGVCYYYLGQREI